MGEYLPPESTKLPFNFTTQGYTPPGSTSVLFDFAPQGTFGTLKAAVNVMQPYWYETHTYAKSCPKYVVGYGSGGIQIIKGRCLYGGIRDLQGIITGLPKGLTTSILPVYINSVLNKDQSDLSLYCYAIGPSNLSAYSDSHLPKDIKGIITGIKYKDSEDLNAFIDEHPSGNIRSYIGMHSSVSLRSNLTVLKHKSSGDINSIIDSHLPTNLSGKITVDYPRSIRASVKSWGYGVTDLNTYIVVAKNKSSQSLSSIITTHTPIKLGAAIGITNSGSANLQSVIKLWTEDNLGSIIGTHSWGSLNAVVGSFGEGIADLNAYILAERHKEINNLLSKIDIHQAGNLSLNITAIRSGTSDFGSILHSWELRDILSAIDSHQPDKLAAMIRGWASINTNFGGAIRSWYTGNSTGISSIIDTHLYDNLQSIIDLHQPEKLGSIVRGWGSIYKNLGGSLRPWYRNNFYDITSVIDMHQPIDFQSFIDLHQPINLLSTIGVHTHNNLQIILRTWFLENQQNLYSGIIGLQQGNISAYLSVSPPGNLRVYLRAWQKGVSIDLIGNLYAWQESQYLNAIIGAHSPINIQSTIRGLMKEVHKNLVSSLHGWQTSNLESIIGGHTWSLLSASVFLYAPPLLNSSIRGWALNTQKDLNSMVRGWQHSDLNTFIGVHQYGILNVILRSFCREEISVITGSAFGWKQGNLSAYLGGALPEDLRVYIRSWQRDISIDFSGSIYGWENSPNLNSLISAHHPDNIRSIIRGWGINQKNLIGILHSWQVEDLTSNIFMHPYCGIKSSIRGWFYNISKDITSKIMGWQSDNLNVIVNSHIWGLLGASLSPHLPPPIRATIRGWAVNQQKNLCANAYGWQDGNLGSIVGGHRYGVLNIILKSVHIAVAENITGNIHGWQQANLGIKTKGGHFPANFGILLKGVVIGAVKDVRANIHGWQQANLGIKTKGGHRPQNVVAYINIFQSAYKNLKSFIRGWIGNYIPATIGGHLPPHITASIRSWYVEKFKNLSGYTYGWDKLELQSTIGMHTPITLWGLIKPLVITSQLFPAYVHGWQQIHLGMALGGTHNPIELFAQLQAKQRRSVVLPALIYAWHSRDILASLNIVFLHDLQSIIYLIPPSDLSGYLKARLYTSLPSRIYGWQDYNLCANVHPVWAKNLFASVYGITDTKKNLSARIGGYVSEYKNLYSSIIAFQWNTLNAILKATYLANIQAYIFAVAPKNLCARVHVWHERFLQGILNGQNYPWNLTAQICSKGDWATFTASISPRRHREIYGNLKIIIHPWDICSLAAYVVSSNAPTLSAYLNPLGYARDLHGSIRPKMIRLTTIINIPTQLHNNISATINYPCFKTGYDFLASSIYVKYKSDLYAYIKPIFYNYKPKDLSAKIGYTDSYSEVDKLKLSINIYPSEFFTEDKFKLLLRLLDAESLLTAYIRGTLRYNGISAQIICDSIPSYTFNMPLKNRETVVHKTYADVFKTFETVEIAFKSAVADYFFSTDGGFAWKNNRFDKWVLSIRSILPSNISLGTIRRMRKSTTMYDLKKFKTVDEAMKAAIAYVTEYPQSTLGASIVNLGTYRTLTGIITPKYTISSKNSLESTITPIGNTIFIGEKETISKI